MLAVQSSKKRKDQFGGRAVKIARRLIGEKDLRTGDQSTGQGQALLLSARELAGAVMTTLLQPHLAEPAGSFPLGFRPRLSTGQQGHSHILPRREFRQQVMKLPHVTDLAVAKLGGCVFRKRMHLGIGAVYGTARGAIKGSKDMQQSALSRARLTHYGEHLSLADLERQILKEHEVGFA